MLEFIEKSLEHYPQILKLGEWFSGLATFLASIISLWLAFRARYSKIKAILDINNVGEFIKEGDKLSKKKERKALVLKITNYGPHPIYIKRLNCLIFQPLLASTYCTFSIDTSGDLITILPGTTNTSLLPNEPKKVFDGLFKEILGYMKENKLKAFLTKFFFRFIGAYVIISDGRRTKIKITKGCKKIIVDSLNDM
ncbi:MAG: hypothetical protein K2X53_03810 [Alphaproteobacteria bacterium]|nr:hypothetical protein [Alphaproteobacteria bacterium]